MIFENLLEFFVKFWGISRKEIALMFPNPEHIRVSSQVSFVVVGHEADSFI